MAADATVSCRKINIETLHITQYLSLRHSINTLFLLKAARHLTCWTCWSREPKGPSHLSLVWHQVLRPPQGVCKPHLQKVYWLHILFSLKNYFDTAHLIFESHNSRMRSQSMTVNFQIASYSIFSVASPAGNETLNNHLQNMSEIKVNMDFYVMYNDVWTNS